MRQIGPVRAALSNFLGIGIGYVYVGRIELAFAFVEGLPSNLLVSRSLLFKKTEFLRGPKVRTKYFILTQCLQHKICAPYLNCFLVNVYNILCLLACFLSRTAFAMHLLIFFGNVRGFFSHDRSQNYLQ